MAIGDIDLATVAAFNVDLRESIDDSEEALVSVDCSGVTFIDSSGYHALADATEYATRRGHTLVIRNASPSCALLIRLCDRDRDLRVETCPQHPVRISDAFESPKVATSRSKGDDR